jgi:ABC-type antimicrobial peptide transport system permease subunit
MNGGFITYGNSFLLGFFIVLIGGILASLFSFVLFKFIDPGLVDTMIETAREKMESRGDMSEEQIDMALEMSKTMMSPLWMMIWGLAGSAFIGAILSLIVSIFMKKEGTPFDAPSPDNTIQP